jgi:hypothetical protein
MTADGKRPVCGIVGYLQILNKGKCARIGHYDGMENRKPIFHYHQLSIEEDNRILASDGRARISKTDRPVSLMTQILITNYSETKELASDSKQLRSSSRLV